MYHCYHLQTKLREGHVITPVCQSFCSQGGVSQYALGRGISAWGCLPRRVSGQTQRQTPPPPRPRGRHTPRTQRQTLPPLSPEMTIEEGGTRPTGIILVFMIDTLSAGEFRGIECRNIHVGKFVAIYFDHPGVLTVCEFSGVWK